jgi:hypothetical protein
MIIRDAVDGDLGQIAPFFRAIVAAGETYAYRCKNLPLSTPLYHAQPHKRRKVGCGCEDCR